MSEENKFDTPQEQSAEEETSGQQENNAAEEAVNHDELKKLQEENELLLSRLQRLQADFDNYRKRTASEKKEWFTQAACDLVRELLPVIDNLERAGLAAGSVDSLTEGINLVYKQLMSVLEKQGLEVIEANGREFDPNCHHAVMQVECDEDENIVVEELQKGYKMKERVIRPSMVKVAK